MNPTPTETETEAPPLTWQGLLMASCTTEEEAAEAHARGWRTFRVTTRDGDPAPDETACPASKEAGYRATCATCALCSGAPALDDLRAMMGRRRSAARMAIWRKTARRFARDLQDGPHTPNGVVLYEGPSMLDGSPIVVVATGIDSRTDNSKTDDMIQTWIMPQAESPHLAIKSGNDAAVCGDCVHRPAVYRETGAARCYVRTYQAPRAVWTAWSRGRYPTATPDDARRIFGGAWFRFGAWGDPYAVPLLVWSPIAAVVAARTGYTAQWRQIEAAPLVDRRAPIVIRSH